MGKFWKKFTTVACLIASVLIIGNSVSGLIGEKTNDTDNTNTESSETVEE